MGAEVKYYFVQFCGTLKTDPKPNLLSLLKPVRQNYIHESFNTQECPDRCRDGNRLCPAAIAAAEADANAHR